MSAPPQRREDPEAPEANAGSDVDRWMLAAGLLAMVYPDTDDSTYGELLTRITTGL